MRRPCLTMLALALLLPPAAGAAGDLLLELRVFDGGQEVTSRTRVTVHRAGERDEPVAQASGSDGPIELRVPPGIYDIQAIEERDERVVNIQWAHRLVVMPYPDESGRHLEVLNFQPGFGALQVRARGAALPEVTLRSAAGGDPAAPTTRGTGYLLFVVPAGVYDITATLGDRRSTQPAMEVPRERTRLWVFPDPGKQADTRRPVSSLETRSPASSLPAAPPDGPMRQSEGRGQDARP